MGVDLAELTALAERTRLLGADAPSFTISPRWGCVSRVRDCYSGLTPRALRFRPVGAALSRVRDCYSGLMPDLPGFTSVVSGFRTQARSLLPEQLQRALHERRRCLDGLGG